MKKRKDGPVAKAVRAVTSSIARWAAVREPIAFGVELTNLCNANCTFCGYQYLTRDKGVMSFEVFGKAVDEYCRLGGGDINLTPTVGDTLLDKELLEKIRYARGRKEIRLIWFYTNLIALNQFDVEELLTSGVSGIRVSTCIKDKETYERIYRSPRYDAMLENIETLAKINERLGCPVALMLFLRVPKPFDEVKKTGDYQRVSHYFKSDDIIFLDDAFDSWGGRVKKDNLPDGHVIYDNPLDQSQCPCAEIFRRVNVLWDGRVNNCVCRDLNAELEIGNIHVESLPQIWQGKQLAQLRQSWEEGHVPAVCRGCQRYVPADEYLSDHWVEILKSYLRRKWMKLRGRLARSGGGS